MDDTGRAANAALRPSQAAAGRTTVSFFVPGKPAPQGSKNHVGRGILVESSKAVGPWRERVAWFAAQAMNRAPLIAGPVVVSIDFVFPRIKAMKPDDSLWMPIAPDTDKLQRAIGDALTGTVLTDDKLIVHWDARKRRAALPETGDQPGCRIFIADAPPLDGLPQWVGTQK